MSKFECKKCGHCCRYLRRTRELDLTTEEKRPLYILPGIEQTWLSLYEWEVDDFLAAARKLGREVKIIPVLIAIDQLTNTPLGLVWQLFMDKCPFLNESNLCDIYEKRPLICRLFPVRRSGMFLKTSTLKYEDIFLDCKSLSQLELPVSSVMEREQFLRAMHEFFGEIYIYSFHQERTQMMLIELLKQLESQNIIKLARGRPVKYVRNMVDRKGVAGLFEFLGEVKKVDRQYLEESMRLIKDFNLSREEMLSNLKRCDRLIADKSA